MAQAVQEFGLADLEAWLQDHPFIAGWSIGADDLKVWDALESYKASAVGPGPQIVIEKFPALHRWHRQVEHQMIKARGRSKIVRDHHGGGQGMLSQWQSQSQEENLNLSQSANHGDRQQRLNQVTDNVMELEDVISLEQLPKHWLAEDEDGDQEQSSDDEEQEDADASSTTNVNDVSILASTAVSSGEDEQEGDGSSTGRSMPVVPSTNSCSRLMPSNRSSCRRIAQASLHESPFISERVTTPAGAARGKPGKQKGPGCSSSSSPQPQNKNASPASDEFYSRNDTKYISDWKKAKLLEETSKNWNRFYKKNNRNFFKDRHYLGKEFGEYIGVKVKEHEELSKKIKVSQPPLLLEVGCGVGNSLFPLMREFPELRFVGCDYSDVAIKLLRERLEALTPETTMFPPGAVQVGEDIIVDSRTENVSTGADNDEPVLLGADNDEQEIPGDDLSPEEALADDHSPIPFASSRLTSLVLDATDSVDARKKLRPFYGKCDVVLLLYCLSAVDPTKQQPVADTIFELLKPGGILLFRDYGKTDWAEKRFKKKQSKLATNFFCRYDGTLSYFFRTEELWKGAAEEEAPSGLFRKFEKLENRYLLREIKNRAMDVTMRRVWLQAVFRKPGGVCA